MTWLKGFEHSNIEVTIDRVLEERIRKHSKAIHIARQLSVLIPLALFAPNALQVRRIAEDAEEMLAAYLPQAQIGVTAVVDAQPTMDMNDVGLFSARLAGFVDCSMKGRRVYENKQGRKDERLHRPKS